MAYKQPSSGSFKMMGSSSPAKQEVKYDLSKATVDGKTKEEIMKENKGLTVTPSFIKPGIDGDPRNYQLKKKGVKEGTSTDKTKMKPPYKKPVGPRAS